MSIANLRDQPEITFNGDVFINSAIINEFMEFPGSTDPDLTGFIVNDSRVTTSFPVGFTGALNIASPEGAVITLMRLGQWVQMVIKNVAAPSAALNSIDPIVFQGALEIDMRPTTTLELYGPAISNDVVVYARWTIDEDGTITIGSANNNHWTMGENIGIRDFSFVYRANGA